MLRMLWRRYIAPPLASRIASAVADVLKNDPHFLGVNGGTAPVAPKDAAVTGELQVFRGYEQSDLALFDGFARTGQHPQPGFVVDFLGGRTRVDNLYDAVSHLDGTVSGIPVPGDFHAEAVEWLGLVKTALTASGRYRAMEWGAGWAPWLVAGGLAARHRGITDIKLYGVEAEPHHCAAIRQHFLDNGFPPEKHEILQAAVGSENGTARWPDEPDARNMWGARPSRDGSDSDTDYLRDRVDRFIDVQILGARDLLLREPRWDMVHVDIQGWEGEVCRSCIDTLTERARWVIIGVHSRVQEAELLQLFHGAGWVLDHEKPTHFRYDRTRATFETMVTCDGTQVWRNPHLVPDPVLPAA